MRSAQVVVGEYAIGLQVLDAPSEFAAHVFRPAANAPQEFLVLFQIVRYIQVEFSGIFQIFFRTVLAVVVEGLPDCLSR